MQRFWCGCLVLLCFGSGLGGSVSLAKPPDLPLDLRVECTAEETTTGGISLGFDIFAGKVSVNITLPWSVRQPGTVPQGEAQGRANAACDRCAAEAVGPVDPKLVHARMLYDIAERCRRQGDFDKARTCYEETHLLAPTTRLGRQAIQRLSEIDNRRLGPTEESEPRPPEPRPSRDVPEDARQDSFLEMLRATVPLGTVPISLPR